MVTWSLLESVEQGHDVNGIKKWLDIVLILEVMKLVFSL